MNEHDNQKKRVIKAIENLQKTREEIREDQNPESYKALHRLRQDVDTELPEKESKENE